MYSLLRGVYDHYTQKNEYNVIILGLDNSGKTTLLEKIKAIFSGRPALAADKIVPTVGLNIGRIDIRGNKLKFWDLGGHRDLQSIWPKYYSECHGIIFMVDATDPSRLLEAQKTFSALVSNDLIEGVPLVVLANKEDLPSALKEHEVKEIFNPVAASLMARESKVLAVSALQGAGIKEAIEWLFKRIEMNAEERPPNKV